MELPFSGRCQCGALTYECAEAPAFTANCHCRARTSSASYVSVLNVPISAITIRGEVRRSTRIGDSGQPVENGFCARRGSRMFSYPALLEGRLNIMAASLDDQSWFRPALNIYAASAPPWHQNDQSIPRFDTVPPGHGTKRA
jgi:hypothetical protein